MRHALNIGKDPSLQKIAIVSAVLHLLFITLVAFPTNPGEKEFRGYYVKLVGPVQSRGAGRGSASVRKKRTLPPKKLSRKSPPKKTEQLTSRADMSLEQLSRVAKEIERMRAIQALSKRKAQQKAKEQIEVTKKGEGDSPSGGVGIPGPGHAAVSNSYYAQITRQIWSQWVYPELAKVKLEMIISIKIDKGGKIIAKEIEKSSGNRLFDRSALKAVANASPLPPPPFAMEIGVRFYL